VLFALEEGATHWNVQILWRCFFCAMWGATFISCLTTMFDDDDNDYGLVTKDSLITFGSFSTSTSNSFNIKENTQIRASTFQTLATPEPNPNLNRRKRHSSS